MTQPQIQLSDDSIVAQLQKIRAKLLEAQELIEELRDTGLLVKFDHPGLGTLKHLQVVVALPDRNFFEDAEVDIARQKARRSR